MTDAEISSKMRHYAQRRDACQGKIVELVRGIVPVLHDHNLHECAKPLDAALFQLDALQQEIFEFVQGDLQGILRAMLGGKP